MDLAALRAALMAHWIKEQSYSLDGRNQADRYCIERSKGGWAVFFSERGTRNDETWYEDEGQACEDILRRILEDPTTRP